MIYRKLRNNETELLREMLYEALFVPKGQLPFPKSIIDQPEMAKYINQWGIRDKDLAIGVNTLSLNFDKLNPAQKLYEELGFQVFKEEGAAFTMFKAIL